MKATMKFAAIAAIALGATTMTSCKKEEPLKGVVTYSVVRPNPCNSINFSDVFNVSVTYREAAGALVTVENIVLPWSFRQEVVAPFTATVDVDITLKTVASPPYEFPRPNAVSLGEIEIASGGKRLKEGNAVAGTGSGLYGTVNSWLQANGHTSLALTFTAETLQNNGY